MSFTQDMVISDGVGDITFSLTNQTQFQSQRSVRGLPLGSPRELLISHQGRPVKGNEFAIDYRHMVKFTRTVESLDDLNRVKGGCHIVVTVPGVLYTIEHVTADLNLMRNFLSSPDWIQQLLNNET